MIDAPFARRSGGPIHFDRRDRTEQIQLIVDLRRAVDLLLTRSDVNANRIGYIGSATAARWADYSRESKTASPPSCSREATVG
jgi:hypothetical protein